MKPAGFENVQGIITAAYLKDPTDKQWDDDAEMKTWREWMDKYMPGANQGDVNYVYAYSVSFLMEQTLKKCGDDLTRENVMKQAANLQKLRVPMLLPGITVNTSPTDFYPIQAVQLQRFKGETWELFGDDHVGRRRAEGSDAAELRQLWSGRPPRAAFFFAGFSSESSRATLREEIQVRTSRRGFVGGVSALALASGSTSAFAQKKYDDGATDTEIKIGNTNPYSGPASSYAAIAKTIDAYFKSVNEAAASTAARSSSSRSTTATARPRRSKWSASSSSRTRSSRCSSRSARRATRRSTST